MAKAWVVTVTVIAPEGYSGTDVAELIADKLNIVGGAAWQNSVSLTVIDVEARPGKVVAEESSF